MVENDNYASGEYRLIGPSDDGHLSDVLVGLEKQIRASNEANDFEKPMTAG
jgi:hypothetical protein